MRLFLSSYRMGADPDLFLRVAGPPGRIAVIANASDAWPATARRAAVTSESAPLRALGFVPEEVDLRDHLGDPGSLRTRLAEFGSVWVRGGNTFVLRAQMARSGADTVLTDLVGRNDLAYAGYSAGACVVTPSLRGLEFADDPDEVRTACGTDVVWDGLGWIDHAIVPHAGASELADDGIEESLRYMRDNDIPFVALTDDDALVVQSDPRRRQRYGGNMTQNTESGSTDTRIEHLPEQSRFALYLGDALAAYADYSQHGDLRDFDHTVTDPNFRGRGLAAEIVRYALDATRDEGLKIGTSCSYVEKFVAEHPEYRN